MKPELKAFLRPIIRPYQRSVKTIRKEFNRLLLYPLRKLPVSSESFGPPRGIYSSLNDWLTQSPQSSEKIGSSRIIFASEILERENPKTIETQIHWKLRKEYKHKTPQASLASIKKGRIWVNYNTAHHVDTLAVLSGDDKLIGELSYDFTHTIKKNRVMSRWKLQRPHYLPGKSASLVTTKGEQFYHWIIDLLPKIYLFQQAGYDSWDKFSYIIVNSTQSRFMRETLQLAGIPLDKVVTTQEYPHIKAEELVVPTKPHWTGNPSPWAIEYLRSLFFPHIPEDTSHLPKKIYVDRAKAPYRMVLNDPEVKAYLASVGFTSVLLEDYSIQEQMAMFAEAEAIVAPHGAGLTHLAFCRPGTKVVEFFSPQYVNGCFYSQAKLLDMDYYYFLGEGKVSREGVDPEINIANIRVDLKKLAATMEFAGLVPSSVG